PRQPLEVDQMLVAQHARLQREQKLGAAGIEGGILAMPVEQLECGVELQRTMILEAMRQHASVLIACDRDREVRFPTRPRAMMRTSRSSHEAAPVSRPWLGPPYLRRGRASVPLSE